MSHLELAVGRREAILVIEQCNVSTDEKHTGSLSFLFVLSSIKMVGSGKERASWEWRRVWMDGCIDRRMMCR